MSDRSDDTNHLLLIPPDFFMADNDVSRSDGDPNASSSSTNHQHHLSCTQQYHHHYQPTQPNTTTADSSFRSYCPDIGGGRPSVAFHHSTPNKPHGESQRNATQSAMSTIASENRRVIGEIDRYLNVCRPALATNSASATTTATTATTATTVKPSPEETLRAFRAKRSAHASPSVGHCRGLFDAAAAVPANGGRKSDAACRSNAATMDAEPLMSLSNMWPTRRTDMDGGESRRHAADDLVMSLQEERMRREHCEQTIRQLQQAALERDQRIAVAVRVDRHKDDALAAARSDLDAALADRSATRLALDRAVQRFADEHQLIDGQCERLRREADDLRRQLDQSLTAQRHLNECNELLEQKIAHLTRSSADVRSMHQQQLAELEVRLRNSERNVELADEKSKRDVERLQAEAAQNAEEWQAKEKTLHEEFDRQRKSLKSFYQTQLNEAVAQKLADFQLQIDNVEATLRSEARQRERTIAERALRHMELLVQKNYQECALLSEKYGAEIDLYRIRQHNADKIIETLRTKVESFDAKRCDIAERLHSAMETQWQRALEILATSPKRAGQTTMDDVVDDIDAGDRSRTRWPRVAVESNGAGVVESQRTEAESERCDTLPTAGDGKASDGRNDRLEHYIDMLLEKSPRDVKSVSEILLGREQKTGRSDGDDRRDSSHNGFGKERIRQPWK